MAGQKRHTRTPCISPAGAAPPTYTPPSPVPPHTAPLCLSHHKPHPPLHPGTPINSTSGYITPRPRTVGSAMCRLDSPCPNKMVKRSETPDAKCGRGRGARSSRHAVGQAMEARPDDQTSRDPAKSMSTLACDQLSSSRPTSGSDHSRPAATADEMRRRPPAPA